MPICAIKKDCWHRLLELIIGNKLFENYYLNNNYKLSIIRKTKKPFWKNENGKSGRKEGKTKTESSPTRTQKKDSV